MKEISTTGMHEIGSPSSNELDDANLARMGKRPVLKVKWLAFDTFVRPLPNERFTNSDKRNFGLMSMLGFSCTILITWEGLVV